MTPTIGVGAVAGTAVGSFLGSFIRSQGPNFESTALARWLSNYIPTDRRTEYLKMSDPELMAALKAILEATPDTSFFLPSDSTDPSDFAVWAGTQNQDEFLEIMKGSLEDAGDPGWHEAAAFLYVGFLLAWRKTHEKKLQQRGMYDAAARAAGAAAGTALAAPAMERGRAALGAGLGAGVAAAGGLFYNNSEGRPGALVPFVPAVGALVGAWIASR